MNIQIIDAPAFPAVRSGLIALLRDAVAHGASLGFLSDIDDAEAGAFWDGVVTAIGQGSRGCWWRKTRMAA